MKETKTSSTFTYLIQYRDVDNIEIDTKMERNFIGISSQTHLVIVTYKTTKHRRQNTLGIRLTNTTRIYGECLNSIYDGNKNSEIYFYPPVRASFSQQLQVTICSICSNT